MLGLTVKVGEDGTIQLPKEMLEFAGIKDEVEVFSDKTGVYLRTADLWCDLCGSNGYVEQVGDKKICLACLDNITRITNLQRGGL